MKTLLPFRVIPFLCFVAVAAAEGPAAPWNQLEPAAVLETATGVTRAAYPDADTVWVNSAQTAEYRPDGTSVEYFDVFAKILTRERPARPFDLAIRLQRRLRRRRGAARRRIHKPDGAAVEIDVERHSRDTWSRPGQMQQNIYDPNHRILQVGVPGLEIGDVDPHSVGRRRTTRTRMPDTWSDYLVLRVRRSPSSEESYEVRAPARTAAASIGRCATKSPGTVTYTARGDRDGGTLPPLGSAGRAPHVRGADMPPLYTVVQRLLVSTIPDWHDLSRWYWNLSEPHLEAVTPAMRRTGRAS